MSHITLSRAKGLVLCQHREALWHSACHALSDLADLAWHSSRHAAQSSIQEPYRQWPTVLDGDRL